MPVSFCVLYRFRLQAGLEVAFREGWRRLTEAIRDERGGLGSRLHRGDDGLWYAYAQWPDRESWERAQAMGSADAEASRLMASAIEESLPPIPLEPTDDLFYRAQ